MIKFKEIVSIIRKKSAIFLHLNKHFYNRMRRDYYVFRYFNNLLYLDVILRVNVNISAKIRDVADDQKSMNEVDYYFFYIDNIDADQYFYFKIIDDINFGSNFD